LVWWWGRPAGWWGGGEGGDVMGGGGGGGGGFHDGAVGLSHPHIPHCHTHTYPHPHTHTLTFPHRHNPYLPLVDGEPVSGYKPLVGLDVCHTVFEVPKTLGQVHL